MQSDFRLTNSNTVPLTKSLAKQWDEMKASPTERALDPARIKFLQERAETGLLITFQWAKAKLNGDWLRMNGQHSSKMLVGLEDEQFPKGLYAHIDEFQVDDDEGLAKLFQQFDARKSGRSRTDVCGAYKGLHEELAEVPLAVAKLGIEGIVYFKREIEGIPQPKDDTMYQGLGREDYRSFLLWLPEIFNIKSPELQKPTIVAAMFGTFCKNEQAARNFWRDVQSGGDTTEENHPTRTLDQWYVKQKQESDRVKKAKPHQLYQAAILAWNAFRDGKKLQSIKAMKSDPEVSE